MRACFSLGVW